MTEIFSELGGLVDWLVRGMGIACDLSTNVLPKTMFTGLQMRSVFGWILMSGLNCPGLSDEKRQVAVFEAASQFIEQNPALEVIVLETLLELDVVAVEYVEERISRIKR